MQATSISFPSVDTGYVVGWYGVIQKTTDGGESWFLQNTGILTDYRFNDIVCTDNNTCYAVGQHGIIVKTDNGGLSWEYQNAGTTEDLHEVHFTNQHKGFAVGAKGTILKTNNGGLSSTQSTNNQSSTVTIHPNPVDDILYIKCPACAESDMQLVVHNALGAVMLTRTLQSEKAQVDVAAFVGGIYFYALFTKEGLADRGGAL